MIFRKIKERRQNKNRNTKRAAKISFMYLVSSLKLEISEIPPEIRLTFWRYCNHEAKMKRKTA